MIYQSESIDKIISICAGISKKIVDKSEYIRTEKADYTREILLARTLWGVVFDIKAPLPIKEQEKDFIKTALEGQRLGYGSYSYYHRFLRDRKQGGNASISDFKELREETINFYKGLL
jgi:hypothetical protein